MCDYLSRPGRSDVVLRTQRPTTPPRTSPAGSLGAEGRLLASPVGALSQGNHQATIKSHRRQSKALRADSKDGNPHGPETHLNSYHSNKVSNAYPQVMRRVSIGCSNAICSVILHKGTGDSSARPRPSKVGPRGGRCLAGPSNRVGRVARGRRTCGACVRPQPDSVRHRPRS